MSTNWKCCLDLCAWVTYACDGVARVQRVRGGHELQGFSDSARRQEPYLSEISTDEEY